MLRTAPLGGLTSIVNSSSVARMLAESEIPLVNVFTELLEVTLVTVLFNSWCCLSQRLVLRL